MFVSSPKGTTINVLMGSVQTTSLDHDLITVKDSSLANSNVRGYLSATGYTFNKLYIIPLQRRKQNQCILPSYKNSHFKTHLFHAKNKKKNIYKLK